MVLPDATEFENIRECYRTLTINCLYKIKRSLRIIALQIIKVSYPENKWVEFYTNATKWKDRENWSRNTQQLVLLFVPIDCSLFSDGLYELSERNKGHTDSIVPASKFTNQKTSDSQLAIQSDTTSSSLSSRSLELLGFT